MKATINRPATLAPNAIMVRCVYNACVAWLFYLFKSNFGLNILLSIASATAIKKFNKTDFKTLLIPIYPQIISDELWRKVEMIHQQNKMAPSSKKQFMSIYSPANWYAVSVKRK